jgi:hypothetical protein
MIADNLAPAIRTNPLLPPGWRLIDGATGSIEIAEADVSAVIRSWFELQQEWEAQQ